MTFSTVPGVSVIRMGLGLGWRHWPVSAGAMNTGKPLVTVFAIVHSLHLVLTWWKFHKSHLKTKVVRGCNFFSAKVGNCYHPELYAMR